MGKLGIYDQIFGHQDVYFTSPDDHCKKSIDKHCFIVGHFDWCLEHEATSTDSNGTYDVRREYRVRKADGCEEARIEQRGRRKWLMPC